MVILNIIKILIAMISLHTIAKKISIILDAKNGFSIQDDTDKKCYVIGISLHVAEIVNCMLIILFLVFGSIKIPILGLILNIFALFFAMKHSYEFNLFCKKY